MRVEIVLCEREAASDVNLSERLEEEGEFKIPKIQGMSEQTEVIWVAGLQGVEVKED